MWSQRPWRSRYGRPPYRPIAQPATAPRVYPIVPARAMATYAQAVDSISQPNSVTFEPGNAPTATAPA